MIPNDERVNDIVYDIETYPNCFTIAFEHAWFPITWQFEISEFRNDFKKLMTFLLWCKSENTRLVGFNNVGFDYPVVHTIIKDAVDDPRIIYNKAMSIIEAGNFGNKFAHMVWDNNMFVPQLDLYLIHHFDNRAKAVGLKSLEFAMNSHNLEDLPFPVGTVLTRDQIEVLHKYNAHDVSETKKFYHLSQKMIEFRQVLTKEHGVNFSNFNDTKIGKQYFQLKLEGAGVQLYNFNGQGRTKRQTKRDVIHLKDAILPWVSFENTEFERVRKFLVDQSITETKGVFKGLVANVNGLSYEFGTGGIHASVDSQIVRSDDEFQIVDVDVTSFYPNLAIENKLAPEHLGDEFCRIYKSLFDQRNSLPDKKSLQSATLKLALNGVFGDSNSEFSIFYDPLFTMSITLNGQMLICLLIERFLKIEGLSVIQANTDGVTVKLPVTKGDDLKSACEWWQRKTRLNLERVNYKTMYIRDVNNYLAVDVKGKIKAKGAYLPWGYEGSTEWHKDPSMRVVAHVAHKALIEGANIAETVRNWDNKEDFLMRIKVNRNMMLSLESPSGNQKLQSTNRYYVAKSDKAMFKYMPPLKGKTEWRRQAVHGGWNVHVCNDMKDFLDVPINYDFYIQEVEKLCLCLK